MNSISRWWGGIGLQLKLQILIQGFLVIILVAAQQWISMQFEQQVLGAAKDRAFVVADGAINGLNTLMITKAGKDEVISSQTSRALFLKKMGASEKIKEMRVIRAKQLDSEFPEGLPQEQPVDEMDRSVLASGKTEARVIRNGEDTTLRTVVPFIARKNFRTINCLECHGVDEGAVLGAASVTIDIKDDLATIRSINTWIWLGQGLLQLVLYFVIGSIVRRLLRQLGGEPAGVIDIVKEIARGNLSGAIATRPGDHTSLLAAMQQMQVDLRSVVSDIQTVVDAAVKGDFTRQADLSGKQGFGLEIGKSLNTLNANLLRQIGGNPADAVQVAACIAAGDLSQSVPLRDGDTVSILAAMASMQANLKGVLAEVGDMVNAAAAGNFSRKMGLANKQGYSLTLSELLNHLSDVTEAGLQDVMEVAQAIARGDLTRTVDKDYPGLFGQLKDAINITVERLHELIGQIRGATVAINTAAHEIAAGNQDLSNRTEDQASSLEEAAASMEELNTTVRHNADNARKATELARHSNATASKGGEMVRRVVDTMSDIQGSSKKITDIIGVIDSIAFQTNILALNAAVEAARAGEQGRGFAVVASEVRNLAQRSATSAREIKALIAESVGNVEDGARLVQEAGSTMDEVIHSFQKVADLVVEISDASKEQSGGIAQVTSAISEMDEVTQQNSALVEQAAAAAKSLDDQANGLVRAVAIFKTRDPSPEVSVRPRALVKVRSGSISGTSVQAGKLKRPGPSQAPTEEWDEF